MSKRVLAKPGKTGGKTLASRKPTTGAGGSTTKIIQAKVLEKAKKNNMTGKNFRMQNPKDKDVQALYKANPNIKVKDVDRLSIRTKEEKSNKKLVTTPSGKFVQKVNKLYPNQSFKAAKNQISYEAHQAIYKQVVELQQKKLKNIWLR